MEMLPWFFVPDKKLYNVLCRHLEPWETRMRELPDHPAYAVIDRYRRKGVVVDYVVFDAEEWGGEMEAHRRAAVDGMAVIAARREESVRRAMKHDGNVKREDFPTLVWYPESLAGQPYPESRFFGQPTDPYYLGGSSVSPRIIRWDEKNEYAYAFLEPPYSCTCSARDWNRVNTLLFPEPNRAEIYSWSTNWSNYFDDGLEWWGAYYWTVFNPGRDTFVVVAASATD